MRSKRMVAMGVVCLGLLAIGVTAATYAEPTSTAASGDGEGASGGVASAVEMVAGGLPALVVSGSTVENFMLVVVGFGTLFVCLLAIGIVAVRRREGVLAIARFLTHTTVGIVLYILVVLALVGLLTGFTGPGVDVGGGESPATDGGASTPEEANSGGSASPPVGLAVSLLGMLVVMAVLWYLLFTFGGSNDTESHTRAPAGEESGHARGGVTARGAVTVEDVPPTNGVYRAWREMAASVNGTNDRSATASDVARAAIRDDLDTDAVHRLTRLFEEVRYGHQPSTEEREREARAALESFDRVGGNE